MKDNNGETINESGLWAFVPIVNEGKVYEGKETKKPVNRNFFFPRTPQMVEKVKLEPLGNIFRKLLPFVFSFLGSLYFSLLSTFRLGWRDLNIGAWISRIQPREYTIQATGWVKLYSGVQSLLCVYFLALWALTYFGRPFD